MPDDRSGNGRAALDLGLLFAPVPLPAAVAEADELQRVTRLTSHAEYEPAAAAAAALLRKGVRDVRITGAFLMGVFLQADIRAIPDVVGAVADLLGDAFDAYGPPNRKQVLADNTIGWLLRALLDVLEFHNKERDAVWTKWVLASDEELVDEVLAACERVRQAAQAALGAATKHTDDLIRLQSWFDDTYRHVVERQSMLPALAPAAPAAPSPATQPGPGTASAPAPSAHAAPAPTAPPPPIPDAIQLPVSPALRLLLRKLATFETLVSRGDLLRAAIVSADLRQTLESFDPKAYVPSLLKPYFSTLSDRADEIASYMERAASPSWQALEQLYHVDLDAFAAEPGEPPP